LGGATQDKQEGIGARRAERHRGERQHVAEQLLISEDVHVVGRPRAAAHVLRAPAQRVRGAGQSVRRLRAPMGGARRADAGSVVGTAGAGSGAF
jgi:hypothetical protein